VERHINAVASEISELIGDGEHVDLVQMVIQREEGEPAGSTAFSGRGLLYLNVASDAPQIEWLVAQTGSCSTISDDPFLPVKGVIQTALEPLSPGQYMAATLGLEASEVV
jgi:hypothetical protein